MKPGAKLFIVLIAPCLVACDISYPRDTTFCRIGKEDVANFDRCLNTKGCLTTPNDFHVLNIALSRIEKYCNE